MGTKMFRTGLWTAAAVVMAQLLTPASAQQVNGVTPTEIVIGTIGGLSGPAAAHGIATVTAARMRFDEVNASGGIHGRKLRYIVEDGQYDVPRAVQAGNKLINRDKVFLMMMNQGTPMNNAVFPEQMKANIPNMFPASYARQMVEPLHRLKFGSYAYYYDMNRAMIAWMAKNKGKKRFCSLHVAGDYGNENHEGARDEAQKLGMPLVEEATYRPTDTDFGAQMITLKKANCDLVMIGGYSRDSMLIYTTARNMGWTDVDFVGTLASYEPVVASAPGGALEGFYSLTAMVVPERSAASPAVAKWMDAYKAIAGVEPNNSALWGHVQADLVVMALERAGKDLTVDKFVAAMESIKDYRNIFDGNAQNFGPDKHQGSNETFLVQVRGGKFVTVAGPIAYDK